MNEHMQTTEAHAVDDALAYAHELCTHRDAPRDPAVLETRLLQLASAVIAYRLRYDQITDITAGLIEDLESVDGC